MGLYEDLFSGRGRTQNNGILVGLVRENYDEENKGKLKVEVFYGEEGMTKTSWIRFASPYTENQAGFFFLPEIGSEVLVAYINGNKNEPVVLGCLWNDQIPINAAYVNKENTVKAFKTKGGHEILFHEEAEKGSIQIHTACNLNIHLLDETKTLKIWNEEDKNSLTVDFENGMISLKAAAALKLAIGENCIVTIKEGSAEVKTDNITLEAGQGLTLKGQNIQMKGSTVSINADADTEVKAGASLKLNGSAVTEIKGAMVKIN